MMITCYFGTYSADGGEGVYHCQIDLIKKQFTPVSLFCEAKNSKYIIHEDSMIFTLYEGDLNSGVAVYKQSGELIDSIEFENTTSCYITKKDSNIYTTNYSAGTISHVIFKDFKLYHIKTVLIQQRAGCHQVLFLDDRLLVPCLLLDKLVILNQELNTIGSIKFPNGTGPRHGVFSKDKQYLYVLGELSDTLYTFSIENGSSLTLINKLYLLAPEIYPAKASSAIRISDDGDSLFISVRNSNLILVIDIKNRQPIISNCFSSYGDHPRDILPIIDDEFILIANRNTNNIVLVKLNSSENEAEFYSEISIPGAVTIAVTED